MASVPAMPHCMPICFRSPSAWLPGEPPQVRRRFHQIPWHGMQRLSHHLFVGSTLRCWRRAGGTRPDDLGQRPELAQHDPCRLDRHHRGMGHQIQEKQRMDPRLEFRTGANSPAQTHRHRAAEPGFGKVRIHPRPGNLTFASTRLPTIRGFIDAGFKRDASGTFELNVTLPSNMTAEISPPGSRQPVGRNSSWMVIRSKAASQEDVFC